MKILSMMMVLVLFSCSEKQETIDKPHMPQLNPFVMTIISSDYSMAYGLEYVVTERDLKIVLKGGLVGETDSTIYSVNLQQNEVPIILSSLNLDSLNEHYHNPCIADGSQIWVELKKDNKVKSVHVSNYYQKEIGIAVEYVNEIIPEEYAIWYDKAKLLKDQKRCEEAL
jgi:hypothetical protein